MPAKSSKPSRNLHQRLHAAMEEVKYIQKDSSIKLKSGRSFSVITHDAVTKKVRPALLKQGIVYYPIEIIRTQVGNRTDVDLKVRFANIENPGDFIDVPGIASAITNDDKGPGMAVSYAVKYALLKALGLETGEDADLATGEATTPKVDPRDGAGIPAPEKISVDLISPVGEVEETYPDAQSYMTELANRVKDNGNYWPSNEHIVDLIADRYKDPGYKKWVRQLRKLGKTAYANAQAAAANAKMTPEETAAGGKAMAAVAATPEPVIKHTTVEQHMEETKVGPTPPAPPSEPSHEEKALPDIPPFLARRMKFQLLSPEGKTETFTDPKKFLQALEAKMLTDPVTWWELNRGAAGLIVENEPKLKSWFDGLLEMAMESGKEDASDQPMGAG